MTKHYAGWPVKLKGSDTEFHITAAYLNTALNGDAPQFIQGIFDLLPDDRSFPMPKYARFTRWGAHFVIEVMDFTRTAVLVHDAFAGIRPHDYPTYRPHITIPKDLATQLAERYGRENGAAVIESIGPLTLFEKHTGGEWTAVWRDTCVPSSTTQS